MKVRIKLCGVRTVEDARLCVEAGADEIGVVFAPSSKRRVSMPAAHAIRQAVPTDVPLVGVFKDASVEEIEAAIEGARLDVIQLHGSLPGRLPEGVRRARALHVEGPHSFDGVPGLDQFARLLLDGPKGGGSGSSFAWTLAHTARTGFRGELFVAGGLTPENVARAIAESGADGVDVASGIENGDGYKDAGKVRAFVTAVRGAVR